MIYTTEISRSNRRNKTVIDTSTICKPQHGDRQATLTSTDDVQRRCAAEPRRAATIPASSSSSTSKPPSLICHRALTSFLAETEECIPSARQRPFQDDSDIFLLLSRHGDDPLRQSNTSPRFSLSFLRLSDAPDDDDDSAHRLRILVAKRPQRHLINSIATLDSGLRLLLLDKNSNGVRLYISK